uniref:Titin n=1 Tax=Hucho hucho TaxID=62062 RepID=A0A4W5MSX5_9TELE
MSWKIEPLVEGSIYFFRVLAENEWGIGLPAETPEPLKISEVPQPPGKVTVLDVTRNSVSLKWEKPDHDGGSRISHYEIEMQSKDSDKWTLCAQCKYLETTVTSLAQGEEYQFRVIAVNSKGKSDSRLLANPVVVKDLVIEPDIRPKLTQYSVQVEGRWMKASFTNVIETVFTVLGLTEDCKYDFRIIARNAAGSISKPSESTGSITAKDEVDPPKCEVESVYSQVVIINAGETFTLEAAVQGKPIPTVQWFKSEALVENSARAEIMNSDFKAKLVVKDVIRVDGGQYTLLLTNVAGAKTVTFNVRVLDRPGPSQGPLTVSNVTCDKCSLSWLTPRADGRPAPKVVWTKDGQAIKETTRLNVSRTASSTILAIKEATRVDSGKYKITATNSIGEKVAEIGVIILDKPGPVTGPIKIEEVSSNYVNLAWEPPAYTGGCQINNYIVEKLKWSKMDGPLTERAQIEVTSSYTMLVIDNVNRFDTGKYVLTLENLSGQKSAFINVRVLDSPSAPENFEVKDIKRDSVSLSWEPPMIDGGAKVTHYIVEKRDTTRLAFTSVSNNCVRNSMKIDDLTEGGIYYFRVKAVNELGVGLPAETTEPIKVSQAPLPPGKVTVVDVTRDSVSLAWEKPDHDGGSKITSYTVEMQTKGDEKWSVCTEIKALEATIGGLTTGEEYAFRITAVNDKGNSEPKPLADPVIVKDITIEPIIDLMFNTYSVKAGHDLKIDVPFRGRPEPEVAWKKDGANSSKITIKDATREDFGKYEITLTNAVGKKSATIAVIILDKPGAPSAIKVDEVSADNISLSWDAPLYDGGCQIN